MDVHLGDPLLSSPSKMLLLIRSPNANSSIISSISQVHWSNTFVNAFLVILAVHATCSARLQVSVRLESLILWLPKRSITKALSGQVLLRRLKHSLDRSITPCSFSENRILPVLDSGQDILNLLILFPLAAH